MTSPRVVLGLRAETTAVQTHPGSSGQIAAKVAHQGIDRRNCRGALKASENPHCERCIRKGVIENDAVKAESASTDIISVAHEIARSVVREKETKDVIKSEAELFDFMYTPSSITQNEMGKRHPEMEPR